MIVVVVLAVAAYFVIDESLMLALPYTPCYLLHPPVPVGEGPPDAFGVDDMASCINYFDNQLLYCQLCCLIPEDDIPFLPEDDDVSIGAECARECNERMSYGVVWCEVVYGGAVLDVAPSVPRSGVPSSGGKSLPRITP